MSQIVSMHLRVFQLLSKPLRASQSNWECLQVSEINSEYLRGVSEHLRTLSKYLRSPVLAMTSHDHHVRNDGHKKAPKSLVNGLRASQSSVTTSQFVSECLRGF